MKEYFELEDVIRYMRSPGYIWAFQEYPDTWYDLKHLKNMMEGGLGLTGLMESKFIIGIKK